MRCWLCTVVALPAVLLAGDPSHRFLTAFFGLTHDYAPALASTYDDLVRNRLTSSEALTVVDEPTTQDFQRRTSFDCSHEISRDLVTALQRHFGDSILVSWARIRNYSVVPVRRYLLGCEVRGSAQLEISMVLLELRGRALRAELTVEVSRSKGLILFSPLSKVHVTAPERAAVTSALADAAAARTIEVLESVAQGVASAQAVSVEQQRVDQANQPLRDVFSVPIAEPPIARHALPPADTSKRAETTTAKK